MPLKQIGASRSRNDGCEMLTPEQQKKIAGSTAKNAAVAKLPTISKNNATGVLTDSTNEERQSRPDKTNTLA